MNLDIRVPPRLADPPHPILWWLITRPHLLVPAWASAASGAAMVSDLAGDAGQSIPGPASLGFHLSGTMIVGLAAWSLAIAAVHLVNLAADRESDLLNQKNLFWQGPLHYRVVYRFACGLALAAVGFTLALWWLAGGGSRPAVTMLAVAGTLLLGILYSLPPIRLSGRWGADLLANVCGYGWLAPWCGAALAGNGWFALPKLWPALLHLVPLVGCGYLWSTLLDTMGDRATGRRTWGVRWGERATSLVALGCTVVPMVAAWIRGEDRLLVWVALLLVLGWGLITLKQNRPRAWRLGVKLAVLAAAAPALATWPLLVPLLLVWLALAYGALRIVRRGDDPESRPTSDPPRGPSVPF